MASKSLQIERHPPIPLSKWYERRKTIDFEPPYQRKGGIWSIADRALLIDTIINGFDIPKFYVSDFGRRTTRLSNEKYVYAVIDGKQRFQAIFDFMSNEYPLDKEFKWRFDPDLELSGLFYRDLGNDHPRIASIVDEFVIDVMSVSTDDPEDINKIFKRLNKGKALTGAEVRNAALGPVADMIRVVANHDFFQESVSFNTLRLGDQNAAGKLLLFEYLGYPTSTKKKDLDQFVNDVQPNQEAIEAAGLKCISHLDLMYQAFGRRDSVLRSAGQLPAYYWLVRLVPREVHKYVRDFLYLFDRRRAANRLLQTENRLDEVDPTLARYDVLNRNTNDAGSHRARISILLSSFETWLRKIEQEPHLAAEVRTAAGEFNRVLRERFGHEWAELRDAGVA
jgi:hypothetical protein